MKFWTTDRRGVVEIVTFSNPPHNYLNKPVIDELEQLVAEWRDPAIRAIVIQSSHEDAGFFTQYSVEELNGLASDPAVSRYAGALVRGYKAIFDQMMALPKVIIAAMNGDAMGGGFELTLACDLRIGQNGDFRYGNPEVRAGVVPGAGGTQRVTRLVWPGTRARLGVARPHRQARGRAGPRPRPRGRRRCACPSAGAGRGDRISPADVGG
jgi:enoyl-CoA hydratase